MKKDKGKILKLMVLVAVSANLSLVGCSNLGDGKNGFGFLTELNNGKNNNDTIDYFQYVYGLEDEWTSETGMEIDYLKNVHWDEKYIRNVVVDASEVDINTQGVYTVSCHITAVNGIVKTKDIPVLVVVGGSDKQEQPEMLFPIKPTEKPTPEPTEESTPEPTEKPTPEPTKEPTPEPTKEPTLEPTPEPTKTPEITIIPVVTPEPTTPPEVTVTPEPTITPEATATPEATVTPEPTITPEATVTPEPTITPEATATPEPTVTPNASISVDLKKNRKK